MDIAPSVAFPFPIPHGMVEWKSSIQQNLFFWPAIGTIVAVFIISTLLWPPPVKVPVVTITDSFIPDIISKYYHMVKLPTIVFRGYEKYRDSPFQVPRTNGNLIVLPAKYGNELRNLSYSTLNSIEAAIGNRVSNLTDYLLEGFLHTDVIQKRLTPALGRLVPRLLDELDYSFKEEFPKCDEEWTPVSLGPLLCRIIARTNSRVFVGEEACRNETWLHHLVAYAEEVFYINLTLRFYFVPTFLRPVLSRCYPSFWRAKKQLQTVQGILVPIIAKRRAAEQSGDMSYEKPDDFLQWMMDLAKNEEAEPANLAHRLLALMSAAVVGTTNTTLVHAMYDLTAMPEYIEPLRQEIEETLPPNMLDMTQASFRNLKRLDSFMKESQRVNPNFVVSFQRIVKKPITLSSGLYIPKDSRICMPAGPISMDPSIIQNAEEFDGFRWLKSDSAAAVFAGTNPTHMHFGLGKYACPGRFLASIIIKAILVRIISEYDFKFEGEQQGRPKNLSIEFMIVPDPSVRVLLRKRVPEIPS